MGVRPFAPARYAATALLVAASYFVSGKIGLALAFVHANATAVWPPTGIALAALLLFGYRMWPAVMLGAFLVNWTTQGTGAASIGIAAGNTLEALIGAYLVNRFCRGRACFDRTADTFKYALLASLPGPVASATIGVTVLSLCEVAAWHSFGPIWMTWLLGDIGGALVVAPVLILLSGIRAVRHSRWNVLEALLLLAAICAVGGTVFCESPPLVGTLGKPLGFVCLPLVVWAAFRFGSQGAATASILLAGIATWGTSNGQGPFATDSPNESLLYLQAFMAIMTVTALAVAAEVNEHIEKQNRLRNAEEQSRMVVESALDAIVTIDEAGNVVDWNPSAESIFGWRRAEALGRPIAALVIPENMHRAHWEGMENFSRTGQGQMINRRMQLSAVRKDGTEFPVELTVLPLRRLDGQWQFSAFLRDISERKAHETAIEAANRTLDRRVQERTAQLELITKDLESFCYTVSHDLRAPLRHILGFLDILKSESSGALSPKSSECLGYISESAHTMDRLIDDLLAFSRMGQAALNKAVVPPRPLIEALQPLLMEGCKGRDIAWKIGNLPDLYADPSMLRQVFLNLISNALKFSASREQAVVEVGAAELPGHDAIFVRDNGIGFDMKYADRIFDPFHRLHSTADYEGSGIGLAFTKRIVEKHGGKIWAQSEPGKGATFYVALPHGNNRP